MKIKQIILEGFKSYGKKTVLDMLDPQFNAITGLNGSGKSNVLDAICFCLGLTTLRLARVSKLHELIYLNGQAGVREASVTLVFDNTVKEKSPSAYKDCDHIYVTRKIVKKKDSKSSYYINGKSMTTTQIKSMFKNVGLNIDNPETFFVKQGRITKIINFKPLALREMLEEAAGIAYYKGVSVKCTENMEKKAAKHQIEEERMIRNLGPRLKQLDREKKIQQEYDFKVQEEEDLAKKIACFGYCEANNNIEKSKNFIANFEDKMEDINREISDLKIKMNSLREKCKINQDDGEEEDQEIKELKRNLDTLREKKKHLLSDRSRFKDEFELKEEKIEEYRKDKFDFEEELDKIRSEHQDNLKRRQDLLDEQNKAKKQINDYQKLVEKFNLNLDNSNYNMKEQFAERNKKLKTDISLKEKEISNMRAEIKKCYERMEKLKLTGNSSEDEKKGILGEIAQINKKLSEFNRKTDFDDKIDDRKNKIKEIRFEIRMEKERIERNLKECRINTNLFKPNFRNPPASVKFDRGNVHGYAYTLFEFNPLFKTAIDQSVGGRLYSIVVQNFETGRILIKHRCFNNFIRFIPLDTVKPYRLNRELVEKANRIAQRYNGKVWHALSNEVVKVKNPLHRVVAESLFGNFFITSNLDIAADIAKELRINAIDLEGNSAQSDGMMSGGFLKQDNSPFTQYINSRKFDHDKEILKKNQVKGEKKVEVLTNEIKMIEEEQLEKKKLKDKLLSLDRKIKNMDNNKRLEEIRKMEGMIAYKETNLQRSEEEIKHKITEKEGNEKSIEQMGGKEVEKKTMKKKLEEYKQAVRRFEKKHESIQREYCKIENNIKNHKFNEEKADLKVKEKKKDIEKLEQSRNKAKIKLESVKREVSTLNEEINELDEAVKNLEAKKAEFAAEIEGISKQIKELKVQKEAFEVQMKNSKMEVRKFEENLEKHGRELTIEIKEELRAKKPDELGFNVFECIKKHEEVRDRINDLKPKLNRNADNKNEILKEKMVNLNRFKAELHNNKTVLNQDIEFMDNVSLSSYSKCFESVNKSLSNMFSKLLPGAAAKMIEVDVPKHGDNIKGVQIKVAFGGQWKESLTELSGGQKSLLALSFMLSMLKYKSAPFYILDEIDAAMDLSHTENIGDLISSYFPESQFLVISLKKGMYSNARVLYKTELVDGKSNVRRIVQNRSVGRMNEE